MWLRRLAQAGRRGWRVLDNTQTALGISQMWTALAWALGVIVAALSRLPWYWQIALFLLVANGVLWGGIGIYSLFVHERVARLRKARALLLQAAEAVLDAHPERPGNLDAAAAFGWTVTRAADLIQAAFTYRVVADYDNFLKIAQRKADKKDERLRLDRLVTEFCRRLAEELTIHDLDPEFHFPESFQRFLHR